LIRGHYTNAEVISRVKEHTKECKLTPNSLLCKFWVKQGCRNMKNFVCPSAQNGLTSSSELADNNLEGVLLQGTGGKDLRVLFNVYPINFISKWSFIKFNIDFSRE